MADNISITAGSGTTIATDDVGGVQFQKVKLVDGTADSSTAIASGGGVEAGALRVTIASDSTGVVSIDDNGGAITVDGTVAVTNAGITTIAGAVAGTEMQVDVLTMPTVAVTNAGITSIDGKITACNTGAVVLAAGTAGIGKLTANSGVDIGDVDVLSIAAGDNNIGNVDIVTLPYEVPHTNRVQGKVDNADTTTAREVVAAIASNYVYITSFIISAAVAGNYWLEDGDAAQITPKFYLAANGGVSWTAMGQTPYKTTTVNKAINVKGSVSGAVGVMLTGYKSTT